MMYVQYAPSCMETWYGLGAVGGLEKEQPRILRHLACHDDGRWWVEGGGTSFALREPEQGNRGSFVALLLRMTGVGGVTVVVSETRRGGEISRREDGAA